MLPPDRKLTKAEIDAVRQDAAAFVKQPNRSQAWLSKKMGEGYGAAVISNWFNFAENRAEEIARKVNDLMELDAARKAGGRPTECVDTSVAIEIWTVCQHTNKHRTMGEVIGPAGIGKSMALRACEHKITGCIYMRCGHASHSPGGFMRSLARRLGISPSGLSDAVLDRIFDHLRGTDRLLILDEGQQLSLRALNVVRDIHDETGIPIVLAGKYDLHELVDDATVFGGQMASRIAIRVNLAERCVIPGADRTRRSKTDARPLYTVSDVVRALDLPSSTLRFSPEAKAYLTELACAPGLGALRLCVRLIEALGDMPSYRSGAKTVEPKTIRSVLRKLHGIDGHHRIDIRVEQSQRKRKTA